MSCRVLVQRPLRSRMPLTCWPRVRHRGALYWGACRCVCSRWDVLDCTEFICWTIRWTMCSFIRCTSRVHTCIRSHSLAFRSHSFVYDRIRSLFFSLSYRGLGLSPLAVRRTGIERQSARGEQCAAALWSADAVSARHVGVACNARRGSLGNFAVGQTGDGASDCAGGVVGLVCARRRGRGQRSGLGGWTVPLGTQHVSPQPVLPKSD